MSQVQVQHNWNADQWDWPLQHNDGVVRIHNTPEKFEVGLDASFFTPKEIDVKIAGNNLLIHCKHEERTDQFGTITREISRTYHLPSDVDAQTIHSHLTRNGVLKIAASKKH
uniref:SHSP domain-containing protein n=1 Tax=Acrobeloides nanus TaxID=290746 RepID=A0A914BVI9_9BILA